MLCAMLEMQTAANRLTQAHLDSMDKVEQLS
jgi:hypothetical protein